MSKRKRESTWDVDLYCKIRECDLQNDHDAKEAYMSQLSSPHALRCVEELLRCEELANAFDEPLCVPGLRDGWSVSQWHKYSRYSEKVICYAKQVSADWEIIVPQKATRHKIDPASVKAIEGKCPRYCKKDAKEILEKIEQGQIFTALDNEERQNVWQSLLSIDHLILSLFTLLEDLHFLHTCAQSLNHLMKFPRRRTHQQNDMSEVHTVDSVLRDCFRENKNDVTFVVEVSSRVYYRVSVPTNDHFDLAQRQLWLYVIRNFRAMPRQRQKNGRKLLAKAELEKAEDDVLNEFADLAYLLGFESPDIDRLKSQTQHVEPRNCASSFDSTVNPRRRSGTPHDYTYEKDKELLFLHNLHEHTESFTSFFVLRSTYFAFFGREIGESQSFEFTPSVLEELKMAARGDPTRTTPDSSPHNTSSPQETPTVLIQQRKKRMREDEDQRQERRKARRISDQYLREQLSRSHLATISFRIFKDGRLETKLEVTVDPSQPSEVENAARKFMEEGFVPYSTDREPLMMPNEVFDTAISSGLNTIILLPKENLDVDSRLAEAILELKRDASKRGDRNFTLAGWEFES